MFSSLINIYFIISKIQNIIRFDISNLHLTNPKPSRQLPKISPIKLFLNNPSSLKVKLDLGMVDGKTRIKTFSNLKNSVNTQDVYDVANSLMALKEHGVLDVCKVDNTSLMYLLCWTLFVIHIIPYSQIA